MQPTALFNGVLNDVFSRCLLPEKCLGVWRGSERRQFHTIRMFSVNEDNADRASTNVQRRSALFDQGMMTYWMPILADTRLVM